MKPTDGIEAAEVLLPCAELNDTLRFFTERLGFRVVAISPADDPREAALSAYGLRLRLVRGGGGAPGVLRLLCRDPGAFGGERELIAPNGTRIELSDAEAPLTLPPLSPAFVVSRIAAAAEWSVGRAGMRYRDLIPGRLGGRFIASHIALKDGGPVPDYVHYHKIRLQMIYCYKGWSRLVYEDQGPPFLLREGDCVLQPPQIRHRVLESSAGHEVIELTSPAEHETFADPALELPTPARRSEREFGGQRFVRHEAAEAPWRPWRLAGFEARDLGLAAATKGLVSAAVARRSSAAPPQEHRHEGELLFAFVLRGALTLRPEGRDAERLSAGDCFAVPAGLTHSLEECSEGLELLEVRVPG